MSETDDKPNSIPIEENLQKKYEILKEDYNDYDLSFKVVIIGNAGNYYKFKIMNKYRCWENNSFESRN